MQVRELGTESFPMQSQTKLTPSRNAPHLEFEAGFPSAATKKETWNLNSFVRDRQASVCRGASKASVAANADRDTFRRPCSNNKNMMFSELSEFLLRV